MCLYHTCCLQQVHYPAKNVAISSKVASQESRLVLQRLERLNWLDMRLYKYGPADRQGILARKHIVIAGVCITSATTQLLFLFAKSTGTRRQEWINNWQSCVLLV